MPLSVTTRLVIERGPAERRGLVRTRGPYQATAGLQARLDPNEVIHSELESLSADPKANLHTLCNFVGLDCPGDYLNDCAGIVFPAARKTRLQEDWDMELIKEVENRMESYNFLAGYSFDR